jgi:hypothetical protein
VVTRRTIHVDAASSHDSAARFSALLDAANSVGSNCVLLPLTCIEHIEDLIQSELVRDVVMLASSSSSRGHVDRDRDSVKGLVHSMLRRKGGSMQRSTIGASEAFKFVLWDPPIDSEETSVETSI